ncbi:hypothetical protein OESDEN_07020 [Oesophagostomum dentatum]|uniref:Uncharacterized protein n=1 Tax=Oesophagostomum dentatum TaxID=61180 RepID=A0A0B1T762_OESDE|nr:hypothetical protein OESDEN_07020 [Oesophagostomum dentatum]
MTRNFMWIVIMRISLIKAFLSYVHFWKKEERLSEEILQFYGSFEEYHLLKRFSERYRSTYPLPDLLLNEISKRFDGFFLVYLIHALREHAVATENTQGIMELQFRKDYAPDALRTDVPVNEKWTYRSEQLQSSSHQRPSEFAATVNPTLATAQRNEVMSFFSYQIDNGSFATLIGR